VTINRLMARSLPAMRLRRCVWLRRQGRPDQVRILVYGGPTHVETDAVERRSSARLGWCPVSSRSVSHSGLQSGSSLNWLSPFYDPTPRH
jgi:hypothetical protein